MRQRGGPVLAVMSVVLLLALLPAGVAARDPEPLPSVTQVTVGTDHACALWWSGVSCWGDNQSGKLGNGTRAGSYASPIAPPMIQPESLVTPRDPATPRPFAGVEAGPDATCAVATGQAGTVEGTVWCWGGHQGALGRVCVGGDFGASPDPGMVMAGPRGQEGTPAECGIPLTSAIRVAVGWDGGCALVRHDPGGEVGDLWCWGMGDQDRILAHPVGPEAGSTLGDLVDLDAAQDRTCALGVDGSVWCWTSGEPTPRQVPDLAPAVAIAVGTDHACAQTREGGVWCWGANAAGQLGDGTTTASGVPVPVSGLDGTDPAAVSPPDEQPYGGRILAAGDRVTCVLRGRVPNEPRAASSAWCWGLNDRGQLGDASRDQRTGPVQVAGLEAVTGLRDVAVGGASACVVTVEETRTRGTDPTIGGFIGDQGVRCWGAGDRGQLGIGTWDDRDTPTLVVMTEEPRVRE